ncbi:hypothetical protein, partial [Bradyrhizobium genosp. SA-3]|uniref:hypothetical protein n=1 Tax=Bradyrhizobium genosp. SA-3 TaxID=508868 RepID=UPI001ABF17A6
RTKSTISGPLSSEALVHASWNVHGRPSDSPSGWIEIWPTLVDDVGGVPKPSGRATTICGSDLLLHFIPF